ncbi:MAG: IclR family transcriptional regulator [Lachnospiraceae bacterium]|nr:IclR family transcriptional regulator [Lachnospiraceae bacterium]
MIQSLQRGIEALVILSKSGAMGITELAKELDVDKSTASRLLATLRDCDMVQFVPSTRKYRLGFRILHLSEALTRNLDVIDVARPILKELSFALGQSVHLCMYNKKTVYVIDQVKSAQIYEMSAHVGMIEPMHASSVGKCILAYRPSERMDEILEDYDFECYTNNTISTKERLLEELKMIRQRGYAIDNEEIAVGVRCVAAPIFDYRKRVFYSIGISGPVPLMSGEKVELFQKKLNVAATKIGREMGYQIK